MPVLHTTRHHLRPLCRDDLGVFHEIWSDPEVIWWGASADEAASISRLGQFLERTAHEAGLGWWLVFDKASGEALGDIAIDPSPLPDGEIEIGWHFKRHHWGRGHASEAASCVMDHAFGEGEFDRLVSTIVPMNTRSIALAERLGMVRRPGIFIRAGLTHGVWEIRRERSPDSRSAG